MLSCDVYLGILGTRYGSPVRDRREVSYTELEFDTATVAGLPRLVFMLDTEAEHTGIPAGRFIDPEFGRRQEEFRRRVRDSGLLTQSFTDPATLGQLVERSLREMRERRRTDVPNPTRPNPTRPIPADEQPTLPPPEPPVKPVKPVNQPPGPLPPDLPRRRKRRARSAAGITALAALLAALGVLFWDLGAFGTPHPPKPTPTPSRTQTPAPPPTAAPPACGSGTLTMDGSDFGSVARTAATAYSQQCPNAHFDWGYDNGKDSAWGAGKLESAAKGPSKGKFTIAIYDGTTTLAKGMTPHPVGIYIYSVVAHTNLYADSDITRGELKQLYDEPGCVVGKLAVGLQDGSATRRNLLEWLKKVPPDPNPPADCENPPTSETENTYEAALGVVSEDPDAIAYMAVDKVTGKTLEIAGHLIKNQNVSVLTIDGALPNAEDVENESYHFLAVENLYTVPHPSQLAQDFLAFLTYYLGRHPAPDFITCASAPKSLAAQCPTAR